MDKKTVRRVVIIALAVLLVEQIFFLICGFGLPAQYGDTFMGELKSKYERLKETPGQRIVLVGGSGVAFDCDSEMIDEIFPSYEVVNFGMYAGLGTKAVMDLSEAYIREGDIVILSPEQSEQTLSDYFNGEYMWLKRALLFRTSPKVFENSLLFEISFSVNGVLYRQLL